MRWKGLLVTFLVAVVAIALVNRISFLKNLVVGA